MCVFVYFAPSHVGVMQALKVVQPSRPNSGTLAALARLNIGTLGNRGHQSGNNWPGFFRQHS